MKNGAHVGIADNEDDAEDAKLDRRTAELEMKVRELEKQKADLQLTHQLARAVLDFTTASVGTPQSPAYLAMKARRDAKKGTPIQQKVTINSVTSSKAKNAKK